jgi:hypothetical protein
MPSGIGTAGGRRPARVRLPGRPALHPQAGPMSAVGMTAKNVTVRSLTRCSPRSSSSRPPSRASGAATPTGPGTTFRLLGVPVRVSTQVPGTLAGGELILADMNQVALGRDTAPSLGVHRTLAHSDQLACIACGQQWRATSLRGRWWQCPNRCNQSAAYQRTGHLPVTDRVDRATTPGRLPLAPGRGRDQAGGSSFPGRSPARLVTEGVRTLWHLSRQERRYGLSAVTSADGCAPGRSKVETSW